MRGASSSSRCQPLSSICAILTGGLSMAGPTLPCPEPRLHSQRSELTLAPDHACHGPTQHALHTAQRGSGAPSPRNMLIHPFFPADSSASASTATQEHQSHFYHTCSTCSQGSVCWLSGHTSAMWYPWNALPRVSQGGVSPVESFPIPNAVSLYVKTSLFP